MKSPINKTLLTLTIDDYTVYVLYNMATYQFCNRNGEKHWNANIS